VVLTCKLLDGNCSLQEHYWYQTKAYQFKYQDITQKEIETTRKRFSTTYNLHIKTGLSDFIIVKYNSFKKAQMTLARINNFPKNRSQNTLLIDEGPYFLDILDVILFLIMGPLLCWRSFKSP